MKAGAVCTLIVFGAVLILAPVVADSIRTSHVARLLEAGANSVTLDPAISTEYAFGCWLAGAAMVGVGVWLAVRFSRDEADRRA